MEKVYDVNEEGEEIVRGFNRYDLVNLEAKDTFQGSWVASVKDFN